MKKLGVAGGSVWCWAVEELASEKVGFGTVSVLSGTATNVESLTRAGVCLALRGDLEEAAAHLKEAVRLKPNSGTVREFRAGLGPIGEAAGGG